MMLSIIIVNYNTKALLEAAINSVISNPPREKYEIIVVDNASRDESREFLTSLSSPEIIPVLAEENLGFSKANNLGLERAQGDVILFLNPDTKIPPETLDNSLNYLKNHPAVGALGCRVLLDDGTLDLACRRSFPTLSNSFFRFTKLSKLFPKSRLFAKYNLTYMPEDEVYPVECLVGAYMMIPRKVLNHCGSFDEDYFMYGEDIDLCYRIHKKGYEIIYLGTSAILHHKRASSVKSPLAKEKFYESMLIYYNKHHRANHSRLTSSLVEFGIKLIKKINL